MDRQAGRGGRLGGGVGEQVVDPLVPQLAELGAAHADDGHLVADPTTRHALVPSSRSGLPEIVVHALGRVDAPEGHDHPVADGQLVGPGVGELAAVAAAAVEVDDDPDDRGRQAVGQMVDGEGGHGAPDVGQAFGPHLVDGPARQAGPGRRHVAKATGRAGAGGEGVLPALGAAHDRRPGALGIGAAGRLAVELAPPGQEGGVGEVVAARGHLLGHGRHPGGPARRLGLRSGRRWCATPGHRPRRPGRAPRRPDPARPARARRPGRARPAPRRDCRPTPVRSGATVPAATPRPAVTALTARAWRPDTMAWSTSFSVTPADLRASAKASRAKGTYISSPKRSSQTCESTSPGTRQRSRNSSLAAPRPMSSATAPSAPQRKATPPSPVSRSSAPPARPVRRSDTTARVRRVRRGRERHQQACRAAERGAPQKS